MYKDEAKEKPKPFPLYSESENVIANNFTGYMLSILPKLNKLKRR